MIKKISIVTLAILTLMTLVFPFSMVSAKKETFELTGTIVMYPQNTIPSDPTSSPFQTGFPAGESGHRIVKWTGLPCVWDGDIIGDGGYDGNWVMKNIYNEKDMIIKATGIYTLEDVAVEGVVGTGSLTIKIDHNGLTIIRGTESLKGLGGKGTLTGYGTFFSYNIEAFFN
jgi:hypothetical protein